MKRIIKDFKTVTKEQMDLILDHFPDGFDVEDLKGAARPEGKTNTLFGNQDGGI